MAEIVKMPRLSDTMTEGTVSKWIKKVGDKVKSGDILAEIDSDKATMEFESFYDGTLLYIGVDEKKGAPVDSILAIIGNEGEDITSIIDAEKKKSAETKKEIKAEPVKETKPAPAVAKTTSAPSPAPAVLAATNYPVAENGKTKASPLAKRLAKESGILINKLKGTGEGGRIVKRDIESFRHYGKASSSNATESFSEENISQMRKTIARRLAESKFTAPHFYLSMEIEMDELIKTREVINSVSSVKISFNDFVVKATAAALKEHPNVNSSWLGDVIRRNNHVHIGVAVAVEDGLLVPVVRFADTKTLSQIGTEVKEFAKKAKDKKLQPNDWEGNTFTISNLGMFGIDEFTAIINPPDACILAIGAIVQKPIVKQNAIVAGNTMKVTLSCDHRVVDGATGAAFLQTFRNFLENPVLLLGMENI